MDASAVVGCLVSSALMMGDPSGPPVTAEAPAPVDPFAVPVTPPQVIGVDGYLAGQHERAKRLHRRVDFDFRRHWADYEGEQRENAAEGPEDQDEPETFYEYMARKAQRKRIGGAVMLASGGLAIVAGGLLFWAADDELILIATVPMWAGGLVLGIVGGVKLGVGSRMSRDLYDEAKKLKISRTRPRLELRGIAPLYSPRSQATGISLGFAF
ncbi:MAG TPA: hypothetical protein VGB85_31615 [Nannocystis sp.]|jgi:hypothetical protein